jgi:hypothetical protein
MSHDTAAENELATSEDSLSFAKTTFAGQACITAEPGTVVIGDVHASAKLMP